MTQPRGNGPLPPEDDLAALAALDQALDELAAGRSFPAEAGGEVAALAAVATELREAVPPPPPGAAERGRAALLARSSSGQARGGGPWRRSRPLRLLAVAAALVVLVALPATARQARPGTALWPVREVGQQVRDRLADDPVHRARLRLNTAADYVAAGAGKDEETRKDMADAAEEKIEDALEELKDLSGPQVDALRSRATQLEAQVEALERQEGADDRSGPGGGTELGDDKSGRGGDDDGSGDDDPAGDDNPGSGGGSSSGKGSSGSGSGSGSGSNRSGSGDD